MHQLAQELPGTNTVWEGMAVGYIDMPAGTDSPRSLKDCLMTMPMPTLGLRHQGSSSCEVHRWDRSGHGAGAAFYWPSRSYGVG